MVLVSVTLVFVKLAFFAMLLLMQCVTLCKMCRPYEPRCEKTGLRGFPTRSDTNQAVQLQKMARSLNFQIEKVEGLYYPCSENKGAFAVTAKLKCGFVFAFAKIRFSHVAAHTSPSLTANSILKSLLKYESRLKNFKL